jgi:hypothetical protein
MRIGPVVLGLAEHLQALRMDDVDVPDDIGAVIVRQLDSMRRSACWPISQLNSSFSRLSSYSWIRLMWRTDRWSGLEKGQHGSGVGGVLQ